MVLTKYYLMIHFPRGVKKVDNNHKRDQKEIKGLNHLQSERLGGGGGLENVLL